MSLPISSKPDNYGFTARSPKGVRSNKICLHSADTAERTAVEHYISEKFQSTHNASISEFLPLLLQIGSTNEIKACLGLRPGCFKPMFLEQYLESPVEQQVARIAKRPIDRHTLIEVGNLAVSRRGSWMALFVVMAEALAEANFEWMVFTVTREVEQLIQFLGFEPHYLAAADPSRLVANPNVWGSYYQHQPRVMVGSLDEAAKLISNKPSLAAVAGKYRQEITETALSLQDYRRLLGDLLR